MAPGHAGAGGEGGPPRPRPPPGPGPPPGGGAGAWRGPPDLPEFPRRLRHAPALRFETGEQIKARAERSLARANEATPNWFGKLPKTPCVLQEVPEVGAADAPLAFYLPPASDGSRPGVFFITPTQPPT